VIRYAVQLSFVGTGFSGLQRQPGHRTVQGEFETALGKLGSFGCFAAAGRTDAGVHARAMPVSFDLDRDLPSNRLLMALNAYLPPDLAVLRAARPGKNFHARYGAKEREYRYFLWSAPSCPPLLRPYVHRVSSRWDEREADRAGRVLEGRHDFSAFCRPSDRPDDPVRTVHLLRVRRRGPLVILAVRGDGFLTNMVRLIGGGLDRVARSLRPGDWIRQILESRRPDGAVLPPVGLFFWNARYLPSPWIDAPGRPGGTDAIQ
jgi:tRNA pseudouridine38-40 synthase